MWQVKLKKVENLEMSTEHFFELTEELKKDRAAFSKYAGHILNMIASSY